MTYTESLKQGASRMRRVSKANPFELLVALLTKKSGLKKEEARAIWGEEIVDDPLQIEAVLDHTFGIFWSTIHKPKSTNGKPPAPTPETRAEQKAKVAKAVEWLSTVLLLDRPSPNGTAWGDCTEDYLYRLTHRRLGKKGSRKKLRDVYSNDELSAKLKGLT